MGGRRDRIQESATIPTRCVLYTVSGIGGRGDRIQDSATIFKKLIMQTLMNNHFGCDVILSVGFH